MTEFMQNHRHSELFLKEIQPEDALSYFQEQMKYLQEDRSRFTESDQKWFESEDYRGWLISCMKRTPDQFHLAWFIKDKRTIGACSWISYLSEDGKCFIPDFWIFPDFRQKKFGQAAFSLLKHTALKQGATYFELNCSKPESRLFWQKQGFFDAGEDESGPVLRLLVHRTD